MIPYIGSEDTQKKTEDPEVGFFLEQYDNEIYLSAIDSHGDTWTIVRITSDGLTLCAYVESEDIPTEGKHQYIQVTKEVHD